MTKPVILDGRGQPMRAAAGTLRETGKDRALAEWVPSLKSADVTILPRRHRDVGRARDLRFGNGFAAAGSRRNNVNVIGSGLRLEYSPAFEALGIDPDSEQARDFVKSVEQEWELYASDIKTGPDYTERTHLGGLARQAFGHYYDDGDAVTNVLWSREPGRRFQTMFQNVDPDRLSNPHGGLLSQRHGRNEIKGGVEQTPGGKPVAYWIREKHQSESGFGLVGAGINWRRIPRYVRGTNKRLNFIHYYNYDRAGQSRGKAKLTPVLEKFKKLDLFQDSSLQSAILNAMFTAVIESPFDDALLGDQLGLTPGDGEKISEWQEVRNEFWKTRKIRFGEQVLPMVAPGEKVNMLDAKRPSPEFEAFFHSFMEEMAAAEGMSLEQYTGNWTKTNYSSARAALNEAWKILKVERDEFAIHWYTPIFELWFTEAIDKAIIMLPAGAPGFYEMRQAWITCDWIGPGRGYVDPVKEVDGGFKRIAIGNSSVKKEAGEQGVDYRKNLRQLAREVQEFDDLGLRHPMAGIPTTPGPTNHAQVPNAGPRPDDDQDQEDRTDD